MSDNFHIFKRSESTWVHQNFLEDWRWVFKPQTKISFEIKTTSYPRAGKCFYFFLHNTIFKTQKKSFFCCGYCFIQDSVFCGTLDHAIHKKLVAFFLSWMGWGGEDRTLEGTGPRRTSGIVDHEVCLAKFFRKSPDKVITLVIRRNYLSRVSEF